MAFNPPPTYTGLDADQTIKGAYDEANRAHRVITNIAVVDGSNEILITSEVDSIAIADSSGNPLVINPDGSINVDGTITATNPSIGVTGTTAPTSATEVGTVNPSGNLTSLQSDSSGALKVTGSLSVGSGFSNISSGFPTQISVSNTSIQLFAVNSNRKYAHIFNNSQQAIYIQYQVSAALNQGIKINPGTFFTLETDNLWLGIINAIGLVSNQMIDVLEGI